MSVEREKERERMRLSFPQVRAEQKMILKILKPANVTGPLRKVSYDALKLLNPKFRIPSSEQKFSCSLHDRKAENHHNSRGSSNVTKRYIADNHMAGELESNPDRSNMEPQERLGSSWQENG